MDRRSFEQIYNCYWRELYDYCLYQCRDSASAEEMVQDVFLSLWERLDGFEVQGDVKRYLYRAVKNKVYDYFRARSKQNTLASSLNLLESGGGCFTEDTVSYNDLTEHLDRAIRDLPSRGREVYRLSREQGLTNREIAARLSIAEKTVEQHLTKAIRTLRQRIRAIS